MWECDLCKSITAFLAAQELGSLRAIVTASSHRIIVSEHRQSNLAGRSSGQRVYCSNTALPCRHRGISLVNFKRDLRQLEEAGCFLFFEMLSK